MTKEMIIESAFQKALLKNRGSTYSAEDGAETAFRDFLRWYLAALPPVQEVSEEEIGEVIQDGISQASLLIGKHQEEEGEPMPPLEKLRIKGQFAARALRAAGYRIVKGGA